MTTRNRQTWNLDNQGEYARQIGWKHSRNGKLQQHKFRLGSDLKEAQRRERKIVEFWERIEETTDTNPVVWTEFTLDVAKQLAKGKLLIEIPRKQHDSPEAYARYLHRVQRHYPMISFVAEDADAYAEGSASNRTRVHSEIDEIRTRAVRTGNACSSIVSSRRALQSASL